MFSFKRFLWPPIVALSAPLLLAGDMSLDGTWEIAFDHENVGREAGWQETATFNQLDHKRDIAVPSAWELIEQDYEGVAFYHKTFDVPADWSGKVIRLQFGAVNYIAEIYLNDQPVGMHEGGFTPFEFRVESLLKVGEENTLALRVVGPVMLTEKVIDGIGPMETPQWRGGITGGIWQSVKLVANDVVYVKDVQLQPQWDSGKVIFKTELNQTHPMGGETEVTISIADPANPDAVISISETVNLHPGSNHLVHELDVSQKRSWSPDDPFLYAASISIKTDGNVSDSWSTRFGFREFTIRNNDFYLNGERIFIRATFFEGLYPNGIAAPDSLEMARREIQLAKDAGFNMIRPWRHPPVPEWLDLADEIGIMVVGSPVIECMSLPLASPYLPSRVENEIRQTILRDRNRTSIVQWELFNELHRDILMQMMRSMVHLTRDLDPTRLILDESGGWAFGANMYLPHEYVPLSFNDIHNYPGPLINKRHRDGWLSIGMTKEEIAELGFVGRTPGRNVRPNLMSFVSEIGYGSLPDLPLNNALFEEKGNPLTPAYRYHQRLAVGQMEMLKESGFNYLFDDLTAFCLEQQSIHGTANRRMIEGIRANPDVDGYCVHALTGGDWILGAGLIDLWRNPKGEVYTQTKAANQPRVVSIRMEPRNIYASDGGTLSVIGINDLDTVVSQVRVRVVDTDGMQVLEEAIPADWETGVSELFTKSLATTDLDGTYSILVSVIDSNGTTLTDNSLSFDVFQANDLVPPFGGVAVIDSENKLVPFLSAKGLAFTLFDEETLVNTPVFVVDTRLDKEIRERLFQFIEDGGTAVYTGAFGLENNIERKSSAHIQPVPVKGKVIYSKGLWNCVSHLVRDHPIFDGLPVDGHMRDVYQNVWAKYSVDGLGGETIAAAVGYQVYSKEHKLQYAGPGPSWWGADLAIVPYGKGRCIVSQLRLVDNLGKDPVADKLIFNLIQFTTLNRDND